MFYVYGDQVGRPWVITDAFDQPRWRWDTSPFGELPPNENPGGLGVFAFNLRFPGQYEDKETGLFYNYFRDYDPQTGRYVQEDPIGLAGGINPYAYVGGNPLSRADPLGLVPIGTIPDDPNKAAIFYNRPRPPSKCSCGPPLTPGQVIEGSMLGFGGAGAAVGLGVGIVITGAEVAEATTLIGGAAAFAVAGKTAVTGLALGTGAGAVFGLAVAGLMAVHPPGSTPCPAQCTCAPIDL